MNLDEIRKDFPQLDQGFIYFDSGSTSLKPIPVINAVKEYYEKLSASVGRALHRPSNKATKTYQDAHDKVRSFFNTKGYVVFTKNCTEAINIIAHGVDWQTGDRIVTTYLEHNSNLLPWLNLRSRGVEVVMAKCALDGTIDLRELAELINEKTRLVAVTHASNVLGSIVPVADVVDLAHNKGALVLIDGAQAAPHLKVDIESIGCDFYAASGHKMLGPSGTGILLVSEQVIDQLRPMMLGGGSATDVEPDRVTLTRGPGLFEAGTPNIAGAIGLGVAVDYLKSIGMDKIRNHELELCTYFIEQLRKFDGITVYGPEDPKRRTGVVSFSMMDIPAHRIAIILDEIGGIAIRSGNHCAFLLTHQILRQANGTARASFYLYNTIEEIDTFMSVLREAFYCG